MARCPLNSLSILLFMSYAQNIKHFTHFHCKQILKVGCFLENVRIKIQRTIEKTLKNICLLLGMIKNE